MAVLKREDFFTRINEFVGDRSDDDSIKFVEDMTDTYNEMEKAAEGDGTDWEKRYKENDEAWRKKYRSRFFSGATHYVPEEKIEEKEKEIEIDDLFED